MLIPKPETLTLQIVVIFMSSLKPQSQALQKPTLAPTKTSQ